MTEAKKHRHSPEYGGKYGHRIFHLVLRWFGPVPAYILLAFVVPYYVLFISGPRKAASFYLKHRFPGDNFLKRFFRTAYYIYQFGLVLIDQAAVGIIGRERFSIDFPQWEKLLNMSKRDNGLVLLTSHIGNWQTAMSAVGNLEKPVNFHIQIDEHTTGWHFFDLAGERDTIRIISPLGFMGGLVEVTNVLNEGQCVAIMGDRAWGSQTEYATFLGEKAAFPITPYHLVMSSGSDLGMLLTIRTGKLAFRIDFISLSEDITEWTKSSRKDAITLLFERYVKTLEDYVRKYPYMWFNFFDFWDENKPV